MNQSVTLPRLVLLLKSAGGYAHKAGYYLHQGRWHSVKQDKPVPKGAPMAAHPKAAGHFQPVQHLTEDQWAKLKLPAENTNASTFNAQLEKLKGYSEAGDVTAILGMGIGVNTYGKKLATIANHLLGMHGTEHKVSHGQGAGWHAAVEHALPDVSAQPVDATAPDSDAAPAPDGLVVPEFAEGKTATGVKAHYDKVAAKIVAAVAAGDAAALQAIPTDKGSTWAGKSPNSKKMLAFHADALASVQGGTPAPVTAEPVAPVPAPEPVAEATAPAHHALLGMMPWSKLVLPETNTNASSINPKLAKLKATAYAGDLAALEAIPTGKNTYNKKLELIKQTAIAALKQGAPVVASEPIEVAPAPAPEAKVTDDDIINWLDSGSADDAPNAHALQAAWDAMPYEAKKPLMDVAQAKMDAKPDSLVSTAGMMPAPENDGPADGDTKPGADGTTLVFKDGRWHKQAAAEPAPPAATGVDAVVVPDFASIEPGKWAAPYAKVAEALKAAVLEHGAAGLKGKIISHANGRFTIKEAGYKFKEVGPEQGPRRAAMHQFVLDLKAAAGKPVKAKPAPAVTGAASAPKPKKPDASLAGLQSIDAWPQTGPQGGSNPGGRFKDEHGIEWYCKFPADADIARSEVLAAKLYEAAGVNGQDAKLITKGGKVGIASRWVGVHKGSPADLHGTPGALSGFAVDAWLANHDVVGLGFDNLQIGEDGRSMRVDAGGSLEYRAQGAKKAFGHTVSEIDSMRDASINPQSAAVFGGMTTADMTASAKKVLGVSDEKIFDLVMDHGPGDAAAKGAMIDALIARKEDLARQFPKAAPKEKVKDKPDPTKLQVSADQLPKPHDFMNFKGAGSPLSSKAHVNEANAKAEQDLLDFAVKGNLVALKDYHFEATDKETGAALGSKPIAEHPSQHVKLYWSDLVSTLSYIANPPEALKKFKSVVATSITKVSQAFKSAKYGTTTKAVDANSRLAFWIALGSVKPIENLLLPGASLEFKSSPSGQPKITPEQAAEAKAAYQALATSRPVKRFINGIQSSGTYNDNFRDGRMITTDGHDAVGMTLDAYSYATEKPEGFELYKWINFAGDMAKEMLNAPAGTVFQNPGSMCCSTGATSTSGFGADRVRIRYANGAKGVDSFGSGNFAGEKEITTLPGQRFVILKCHKVFDPIKGKERIELDVLMLPPDPTYVAELETMKGNNGQA